MDIQGLEGQLLRSIESMPQRVIGMKLEAAFGDLYVGGLGLRELLAEVERLGFELAALSQGKIDRMGVAFYGDIFVLRKDLERST